MTVLDNIRQQVSQADASTVACRDVGHHWIPVDAKETGSGYERIFGCRCSATKTQFLDHDGYLDPERDPIITYPEGYLMQPGIGIDARADVRAAFRKEALMRGRH